MFYVNYLSFWKIKTITSRSYRIENANTLTFFVCWKRHHTKKTCDCSRYISSYRNRFIVLRWKMAFHNTLTGLTYRSYRFWVNVTVKNGLRNLGRSTSSAAGEKLKAYQNTYFSVYFHQQEQTIWETSHLVWAILAPYKVDFSPYTVRHTLNRKHATGTRILKMTKALPSEFTFSVFHADFCLRNLG